MYSNYLPVAEWEYHIQENSLLQVVPTFDFEFDDKWLPCPKHKKNFYLPSVCMSCRGFTELQNKQPVFSSTRCTTGYNYFNSMWPHKCIAWSWNCQMKRALYCPQGNGVGWSGRSSYGPYHINNYGYEDVLNGLFQRGGPCFFDLGHSLEYFVASAEKRDLPPLCGFSMF